MNTLGKHLRRLGRVFVRHPVYFITTATANRRPILASESFQEIAEEVWHRSASLYGWSTGPYVLMPDHVHFFCQANPDGAVDLSHFVGKWKEWTSKYARKRLNLSMPLWQPEFFDHVIRSEESWSDKFAYVRKNPEEAGLVEDPGDWPYQGDPGNWIA